MRWFLDLSTRAKLFASFGLMVVLLAVVAAQAYRSLALMQESQKALYEQEFIDVLDIKHIHANEIANRADLLSMMVPGSGAEIATLDTAIHKRDNRTGEGIRRLLERNQTDPESLKRLKELESLRQSSLQTREGQTLPLILAGKLEEARQLHLGVQAKRDAQMGVIVDAFVAQAEQAARTALARSERRADVLERVLLLTGIVAVLLAVAMTLLLNRVIADPLRKLSAAAERVAAGDLSVDVPADGRADETGILLHTFARMLTSLRAMTRDLSTEKQLLRNLMDSVPDAIFFKDREHRFLRINRVHARLLGVPRPEDAEGRPTSDFFPPDEARQRNAEDEEILRTGMPLSDTVRRITRAGGKVRWSSTTKAPIKDEAGQVTGLVGIARDVTERVRLQEELREREAGLRRAQLMAKLAHVITRPDGSFESWSETLPQLIGVDLERMPKSTREWLNIVHPDDRQKFRERAIEAGTTVARLDVEYRLKRADGVWIDVRQVSEHMEGDSGRPARWFGTLQDVTEEKRAAQALRASESLKGAVLESSLDAIVTMDQEGKIVEFNPAAELTFDYERGQAMGKPMAELIIPPRLREAHHRGLAHYLATGEGPVLGKRLELQAIRADGTEFPIELAITPIKSGSTPLFTAFIRDITQRKAAEARISRLNRVYAVLSAINGMIVRVRGRDELFREACRISIELGGFRLVYIALVDDAAQQICPVAWAGDHPELAQRRRPLGPTGPGKEGTASQAIRSKGPVVENDITPDSRNLTYPEEVLKHGYRSAGSFPLVVEGKALGVLGLFAGEAGYFDAEEVKLLQELADDIAFALENIEREEKVRRLTRVRAVLSGINAAIVHLRDREELFREVCRIVIDSGRFRMVWFGLLDKERQRVMPVASAGDVRGFFDAASSAVTHAKPGGHGLTGRAIREMQPVVSNDIQSDPQRTMKDEFRERGINSLAVLPLIIGKEAVGVVNLYAADAGFFDDEELRLLRELAGNISFALDNLNKEAKLRRQTRVNEMLSSINGAIVRIRDRLELFREACRIAVETGGLRFAWLCVVDEDQMRLKPVASAGADEGYLDLIRGRLSLRDDAPEGHGMAAKAVREKRALVVNDAQSDAHVLFKEGHAARGIRSLAVLPLSVGGKVAGTFGLHSGEVGFFDDQEMKLIGEIAGNIAFALGHIEQEQKVERLSRVHAVLSGINALIVRVRDRDELFREACRIAVEAGKLRFAWIGLVDHEAMQLRPVAWAGEEQDFLTAVRSRLSLSEGDPQARALVAQAAVAKEALIANDVANDPRIRFKQEHARQGIRSLAAFPLKAADKVLGVFALHAAEVGFFDADEVRLLSELAGDISFALEHLEQQDKLEYLAYYDSITGLANRTLFRERLEQHLQEAARVQHQLAVVIVDIERFRTINDTFGRQVGDALLKQMAARFLQVEGDPNVLARLGADHFAVIIPHVRLEQDLVRTIEAARSRILAEPFSVDGTQLRVATKAGIAMFPNDGADAESLLRNAEAALMKAKQAGERQLFYTPQMTERVAEKLSLENKLRQALEKSEFVLHYQPKVDLQTRAIVGAEALIRWQSPELGLVPPVKFISLLEETGLILEVGSWALTRAALDHRAWTEMGVKPPRVAVNVSPIQLRQRDFVEIVERAVMEGLAPVGIDLEITESVVMENVEATIEKLKRVRALGIKMAIDDFGTGYSSLAYLARLPVEALKIDRSFIITMLDDVDTATLVQTVITLAHSLKLTVVAEGVDSEEQANWLRLLRCDQMQGYLISKPVPAAELVRMLAKA